MQPPAFRPSLRMFLTIQGLRLDPRVGFKCSTWNILTAAITMVDPQTIQMAKVSIIRFCGWKPRHLWRLLFVEIGRRV